MTSATAVRPAYRPFVLRVVRVERLGPSFARIAFTGDEIEHFGTAGLDQRIKLLVPGRDGVTSDVGQDSSAVADAGAWYENWRALPADSRTSMGSTTGRTSRFRWLSRRTTRRNTSTSWWASASSTT